MGDILDAPEQDRKQCPFCKKILVREPWGEHGYVYQCGCGYKETLSDIVMPKGAAQVLLGAYRKK